MPPDLASYIALLESTSDPANAYFSYSVDDTGEYGVIKANKEGLRLYAAELLKKSVEMEQKSGEQPLFFGRREWLVSDAGYDLIAGVHPLYQSRGEIILQMEQQRRKEGSPKDERRGQNGCLSSMLLWAALGLICLAVKYHLPI
jgi:hypothetical protein